jgi:uncharacterized protein DUF29
MNKVDYAESLAALYEQDETAWLEQMADLVAQRRYDELDHHNLSEFLQDMARRDKREVLSRLVVLLAHLLKWEHQPEQRSSSWRGTIVLQRRELRQLLESGTLRRHAHEVLAKAYREAVTQAAADTGLPEQTFPPELQAILDDVLGPDPGA